MKDEISPFKALDYLRDNAEEYGRCKANVIYLHEFRKSKKSLLMNQSDLKTESAKEAFAYAHEEYRDHLAAIRVAIEEYEAMRWMMIAAQAKIDVWRSLESSARMLDKAVT
jgi:hypothetical protein